MTNKEYYLANKEHLLLKSKEYYQKNKEERIAYQLAYQAARKAAGWKQIRPSRAKPPGTPRKPRNLTHYKKKPKIKELKLKPKLEPEPRKEKYEFVEAPFELSFS
jgi:hypothetical protein